MPEIHTPYYAYQQQIYVYVTPRTQRLAKRAYQLADELGDAYVGDEHLLLAVAEDTAGPASKLLPQHHIGQEQLHEALRVVREQERQAGAEQAP